MKVDFNESDIFSLNISVPSVLIIILFFFNVGYFNYFYLDPFTEFIKIYLFFLFTVFSLSFLKSKLNKKTILKLNIYIIGVLSSILVLIFLIANYNFSETIFETKIRYNKNYENTLSKYYIPEQFAKIYKISPYEEDMYILKNALFEVKIGKSFFGYTVIKQREFLETK